MGVCRCGRDFVCGGCDLPEEACVCIEGDAWRASRTEAGRDD